MHIIVWWKDLLPYLLSGSSQWHKSEQDRRYLVSMLLWASVVALYSFSVVHYVHESHMLAGFQFFWATVDLLLVLCLEQRLSIKVQENGLIVGALAMFWALLASGGLDKTGIYWVSLLPFLVFAVSGIRQGLWWLGLFVLGLVGLKVLDYYLWFPTPYSFAEIQYFLSAFVFYSLIAMILEATRLRQQVDLEHSNEVLLHMREELHTTMENLEKQVEDRTSDLKSSNKRLMQEIEQHKQTNNSLKNTQEQFYQAQKMESLGTLVGGISHDFNNMLSGINANLFLIQRQTKGMPKVQIKLDAIEKLVFHAADMIKQLLTFARKDNVEMKKFDMSPFIAEALKLAEVALPPRMRLYSSLCGRPLPMQGNATQLQQVVMNLVNNARDALSGHAKPVIRLCLSRLEDADDERKQHPNLEGEWIYLAVRDNGSGIAEDKIEHIFEPFFSTKQAGEGTGLGLAMCYGAIQSHGGLIEVESEVAVGTVFHIYLPRGELKGLVSAPNQVGTSLVGNGERILLVDDDDSLRDAHSDVLCSLGYEVLEASNGLEAIKTYAEQGEQIDLVIMDIMMPEMGGMKAAQHILTMNDKVKIFFATGYDKDSSTERFDREDRAQLDAIKRLNKPFTIEVLSKMIRAELARA